MAIGDLLRAFGGNPTYKPQYSSENVRRVSDTLADTIGANLGLNQKDLGQYSTDINANRPATTDLVNRYTNLAKGIQGRTNDPFQNYRQIGDYLSGLINNNAVDPVINNLVNQIGVRRAVSGINPGIDSTADRLQRAGIASKVRLSALQDVINQLTPASNALFNQRQAADAFALNLAPQELQLRNQAAANALLPLYARNANLTDLLNQGQLASALNKSNIFGYQKNRTGLDRWADAADALKSGAWEGLSFYTSLMGAPGMSGGMGGGRQPSAATVNPQLIRESQINQGLGTPNYDASFNRYWGGGAPVQSAPLPDYMYPNYNYQSPPPYQYWTPAPGQMAPPNYGAGGYL